MIFAVATDEMSLLVFATAEEAIAYCEGIDVEAGDWMFWDERGVALSPEFLAPNYRARFVVGSGKYRLAATPTLPALKQVLAGLRSIEANPSFATLAAVQAYLATATP